MRLTDYYVDADSCPVKEEIVETASRFFVEVIFVSSYNHVKMDSLIGEWKYVDTTKKVADLLIMNSVKKGDITITANIGLASILLKKKVNVLSPKGTLFQEENIETALDLRYLSVKARKQGIYGKGSKPFTKENRKKFIEELTRILSIFEGKSQFI